MALYLLLYSLLYLFLVRPVDAIRCQCSTQKGPVPCYNNWCEIGFSGDKEGACALVTSGRIRHFACVRVNKGSADQCMVDKKDGKEVTRCWCKSGDYCNVDLADRVEEDNEFPVSAEEIATTTTTQLPVIVEKDDFVIDAAYDSGTSDVNYDDDDLSWEEDLPIERHIPPAPPRPTPPPGPTLPPWRREYASGGQPAPPPRPPPLPDVRERALPQPRLPPPPRVEEHRVEPTTSSTTTTTTRSTATVPPTTVSTTASTTTPSTTSTQRTTPTTASEAPTTKINAYAFWKKNKEEAARLYKLQKQRYRPMDLFAQKTSSISSTPSTTESTSASTTTESTSTSTSTSTTTSTSTSTTTTTTASTTTEEVTTITEKPTTSVVTTPSTTVTTPSSTLVSTTEKSTTTTEEARKSAEEEKMFRPRLRSTAGGISVFVAILVAMIL